jgi:hypothetical protein
VVLCGLCKDEDTDEVALIEQQTVEFPQEFDMLYDPNVWIADTGASADSTPYLMGATKITPAVEGDGVVVGNGQKSQTEQVIDLSGWKCDKAGKKEFYIQMKDVKVVPDNKFNLFSVTKRLSSGWKLGGDEKSMWLSKDDNQVVFDLKIRTKEGCIFAMYMQRDSMEVAAVQTVTHRQINIQKAHQLLGHMSNETTRATAKALAWELTKGSMEPCESCAVGKAKQKSVPKKSEHVQAVKPGERIYLDISSIKGEKEGPKVNPKRHWCIMVDEATNLKFSDFYQTKDGMVEPTLTKWAKWQGIGFDESNVRLDNAGENKKLQKRATSCD